MAQATAIDVGQRRSATSTPFLEVWLPSFLVFFANGVALFSLNWWLAHSPGGGGTLGVVAGIANGVAIVAVVLVSGAIDRAERTSFVLRVKAALALALALLVVVYLVGASPTTIVIAGLCYVLIEVGYALYMAAIETTVADLAPTTWPAERTASLIQMQPQAERVVAPLAASALLATGFLAALPIVGLVWLALTGALALRYAAAFRLAVARRLPEPEPAASAPSGSRRVATIVADARFSARWIRNRPLLLYLMLVGIMVNLVVFPFYVLLPAYLGEYGLSRGSQALLYGQAATAYGVGMVVSTVLLARFARRSRLPAEYALLCALLLCAILGAVSVSPRPWLVVPGMAALGLVFVILVAVAGGPWLDQTPSEIRARVFSVRRLVVFSSIPLGTSLGGLGGAAFGYFAFLRYLLVGVAASVVVGWLVFRWSARASQRTASPGPAR
jgi:MFS family permease